VLRELARRCSVERTASLPEQDYLLKAARLRDGA